MNTWATDSRMSRRRWMAGCGLGSLAFSTFGARGMAKSVVMGQASDSWKPSLPGRVFAYTRDLTGRGEDLIVSCDPTSNTWAVVTNEIHALGRVSFDGRYWAYQRFDEDADLRGTWIQDLTGRRKPWRIRDVGYKTLCWWPDGSSVVVDSEEGSIRLSLDGSSRTPVAIPKEDDVVDVSADGEWVLTQSSRTNGQVQNDNHVNSKTTLYMMRPDGRDENCIHAGPDDSLSPRLAPNGRFVSYVQKLQLQNIYRYVLVILDRKREQGFRVPAEEDGTEAISGVWSPDSARLAVVMLDTQVDVDGKKQYTGERLVHVDTRGRGPRPLALPKLQVMVLLDWR